jgi:hypothetical protein
MKRPKKVVANVKRVVRRKLSKKFIIVLLQIPDETKFNILTLEKSKH